MMTEIKSLTRRTFLKGASTAGIASAVLGAGHSTGAQAAEKSVLKFGGFTKTFQSLGLNYEETAEAAAEVGWDGIECPVRPEGHVLPERVEDDLPRMVEALGKRKLELLIMATAIRNPDEQYTERILRTASKLGIRYYRCGWWQYRDDAAIQDQLAEIKPQLRDLAQLNKELGMCGLYQNHSGRNMVGAAVWDVYEIIRDLDPRYLASHFDIGHATVEGGLSWRTQYRLIQSHIGAVIVKDFTWECTPGKGGTVDWCLLGKGMVSAEFFTMLKKSGYQAPITQHFEYPIPGDSKAEQLKNHIRDLKEDNRVLRALMGT
ncbi:TIM barrel protein [bacterium]|nr:TIM barrel protein [bacterium]